MGHHRSATPGQVSAVGEYRRAVAQHWLLVRGTGDRPLAEGVSGESLRRPSSARRPGVQKGDLGVWFASVWGVVFGLGEGVGGPQNGPGRGRWGWSFAI